LVYYVNGKTNRPAGLVNAVLGWGLLGDSGRNTEEFRFTLTLAWTG